MGVSESSWLSLKQFADEYLESDYASWVRGEQVLYCYVYSDQARTWRGSWHGEREGGGCERMIRAIGQC